MIRGPEGSDNGDPQEGVEFNLRFETIRQLQTELAPHLSNDGLFVPADDPFPIDTVVRFRVTLPDDFVLIEGTGVVVWSRQPDETGSPPGMAIRYATLAKEAQETIDAIIDAHLASGGVLFNLERDTERSAAFPTDALDYRSLDHPESRLKKPVKPRDSGTDVEHARLMVRDRPEITDEAIAAARGDVEGEAREEPASGETKDWDLVGRDTQGQITQPVDEVLKQLASDVDEAADSDASGEQLDERHEEPSDVPVVEESEGADGVIPEFLERWKEEIDTDSADAEGPADAGDSDVDEAAEPGDRRYLVDVVGRMTDEEETPVRASTSDEDDVSLVSSEDLTAEWGRGRRWVIPLVLLPIVVVGGYLGWQWTQGRERPGPPTEVVEPPPAFEPSVVDVETDQAPDVEDVGILAQESEPVSAPVVQPPTEPARVVESILWNRHDRGTEVVLQGDGAFSEPNLELFPMNDPPRILLRVRGIDKGYGTYEIPIGTAELTRIRTGYHPEMSPPALYVVLDLADPEAAIAEMTIDGDTVRVLVAGQ